MLIAARNSSDYVAAENANMVVFMTGLSSRPAHMRTVAIPPRPIFGQECDAGKYPKLGELRDCYIPFINEFVPLLLEVKEADAEVRRVNAAAPRDGATGMHLHSVEEEARGPDCECCRS